ncbi:MAG TPA: SDR family oxidoreductase [Methylomirabilota bacterium]|jgi:NAD(P)-dependent dehydrogenase (short-subunit alcohol dehydrogenase family)|nr:SDR family oxidoreductase [Methylomirabilota bacterium]
MKPSLDGKVAIVTGTSPNIGAGIAGGLAEAGAKVVCVDLVEDNARQCAAWIAKRGGQALGVTCDVTDEGQVAAMVARAREAYGHVDVLVNNAGVLGGQSVLEMDLERWTQQLAVNLTGTFLCTKHVARAMVERGAGGSIIVIVSTAGHQGQPGNIGYCTSKSGLLNFTRAAAMDLARHRIRVNSLTPTATDAEEGIERAVAWGRARPERRARVLDFAKMIPAGALPSPRHYASAAVFLASDDAEMITGIDLRVDAGAIAKYWPWTPGA